MFDHENICPYPGLRSFTEEESLYFKGRDDQIDEICRLLESNKFLMVTGASGDGKSSVVFAGLIPNARAGFFKSKYNQWAIADFRPERTPLQNFTQSLSNAFGVQDANPIKTEIERGYSSLIDLYKNSALYPEESEIQDSSSPKKGANLLILVDQFEEFFTNPENFVNSVPSQEAQIVINVLLETARIALQDNLPIYVVCTMRSDFIGQCAAFRGLPEYIGFSQFFVPRLKRNQLIQVIEEPAILSGNQISRRLTERLVYDLNEGVDQLPILQHALSRIWQSADRGNEEMDLLHYAIIGGMPGAELPEKDVDKFNSWHNQLSEKIKKSYQKASLDNVLDIHATSLYETAAENYNSNNPDQPITIQTAKRIIAMAFSCLTKIDHSRAVRNRMSIGEITDIINDPDIDFQKVDNVLTPFRRQGNTLIKPFIEEDQNQNISEETVLDITHESLIRNWNKLNQWANKEYEYYENLIDLVKQTNKWIESGKSRNYLLPIGNLNYFEQWWNDCKPNPRWIGRYQGISTNSQDQTSVNIFDNISEFVKRSDKKHAVTRAFVRLGPQRIGVFLLLLMTILLSSFYYTDSLKKQKNAVQKTVLLHAQSSLENNKKALFIDFAMSDFLVEAFTVDPEHVLEYLKNIKDSELSLKMSIGTYAGIIEVNPAYTGPWKADLIHQALNKAKEESNLSIKLSLNKLIEFVYALFLDWHFTSDESVKQSLHEAVLILEQKLLEIIQNPPEVNTNISFQIRAAIFLIQDLSQNKESIISEVLNQISPSSSNQSAKSKFEHYFPDGEAFFMGTTLDGNGGFQLLSEMQAVLGNYDAVIANIDSLFTSVRGRRNYITASSWGNFHCQFAYLLKNKHIHLLDPFVTEISDIFDLNPLDILKEFQDRSGRLLDYHHERYSLARRNQPPNLVYALLSPTDLQPFYDLYENYIQKIQDRNQRLYSQAVLNKNRALISARYFEEREQPIDTGLIFSLLRQSLDDYDSIDPSFLTSQISVDYRYGQWRVGFIGRNFGQFEGSTGTWTRENYYLYPDYHQDGFFGNRHASSIFMEYLGEQDLLSKYYTNYESVDLFNDWLANYFEPEGDFWISAVRKVRKFRDKKNLIRIYNLIEPLASNHNLDLSLFNLVLHNHYIENDEIDLAENHFQKLDVWIGEIIDDIEQDQTRNYFYNELVDLIIYQSKVGRKQKAHKFLELIENDEIKVIVLAEAAKACHATNFPRHSFEYLDSSFQLLKTFDYLESDYDDEIKYSMITALGIIGGDQMKSVYDEFVENSDFPAKTYTLAAIELANGNYYKAFELMPKSLSPTDEFDFLFEFFQYFREGESNSNDWYTYRQFQSQYDLHIDFIDP